MLVTAGVARADIVQTDVEVSTKTVTAAVGETATVNYWLTALATRPTRRSP
jgi:hypothetical protein